MGAVMSDFTLDLIPTRRHLHTIAEMGWGEFETTAYVIERLEQLGWTVFAGKQQICESAVMGRDPVFVQKHLDRARERGVSESTLEKMQGYTGCIALWDTGRPGPVTALRFDIDGVGVEETHREEHLPNQMAFRSTHDGEMHACGHDGHTSVGLNVARWVKENSEHLKGKVKLIFQPAEEGVRGGAAQAVSGKLEDVDYILGCHLAMMCPTGEVCTTPTGVLCTTKLDIRFTGAPAHPTMSPHLGRNALAAACNCAGQLLGMARHGKGLGCVNVGLMKAGECRNVIPVHAELQIEVRGETAEINDYMVDQAIRIAKGTAIAYDVQYEVEKVGEAGELINDEELVDIVAQCAKEEPTCQHVVPFKKIGCSEDYTMLAKEVRRHGGKSCFFVVGADRTAAHHQAEFDFDEKAMLTAFGIFTKALLKLNSNNA